MNVEVMPVEVDAEPTVNVNKEYQMAAKKKAKKKVTKKKATKKKAKKH